MRLNNTILTCKRANERSIELTTSKQVRRVGSSIELPTHRKKVRSC
ncbi:hypothetical protein Q5687_19430 [Microcoleus sp. AT10_D2]